MALEQPILELFNSEQNTGFHVGGVFNFLIRWIDMPGVLIADDVPNIRFLLRTLVESHGIQVSGEAENGVQAIEQAKKLQPDVVLLDLAMPMLNGIEVASILKKAMPNVRIILFTLHVDGLGKSLASMIGIDFVLSKEESISKLAEHLKRLMPPIPTEPLNILDAAPPTETPH